MIFIMPCEGRVTSPYGRRLHPVTKIMEGHHGIDIAKTGVVPILATASGKVSRVQPDKTFGTYGNMVTIKHADGWESLYAHLSRYTVKNGESVVQGEVIGYMGNTGRSTGQHLHFELHKGGWNNSYSNEVNPLLYISDPAIVDVQTLLKELGYLIEVDGISGESTKSAIITFQKLNGLVADGSAGPITLAKLKEVITLNKPRYSDVPKSHSAHDALERLSTTSIINGFSDGTFRPDDVLTRGQMAIIIDRLRNEKG